VRERIREMPCSIQADSPHNRSGDLVLLGIPRLTALHPYRLCVPCTPTRALRAVDRVIAGQLWDGCTFTGLLVRCSARERASLAGTVDVGERCALGKVAKHIAGRTLVDDFGNQAFAPAIGEIPCVVSVRLFRIR
jgi:hypothetical protein